MLTSWGNVARVYGAISHLYTRMKRLEWAYQGEEKAPSMESSSRELSFVLWCSNGAMHGHYWSCHCRPHCLAWPFWLVQSNSLYREQPNRICLHTMQCIDCCCGKSFLFRRLSWIDFGLCQPVRRHQQHWSNVCVLIEVKFVMIGIAPSCVACAANLCGTLTDQQNVSFRRSFHNTFSSISWPQLVCAQWLRCRNEQPLQQCCMWHEQRGTTVHQLRPLPNHGLWVWPN